MEKFVQFDLFNLSERWGSWDHNFKTVLAQLTCPGQRQVQRLVSHKTGVRATPFLQQVFACLSVPAISEAYGAACKVVSDPEHLKRCKPWRWSAL